jgi:hypothetical protein
MAIGASVTFLAISAMVLSTPTGAEEKPARLSQPSLIVTPGSMAFSGPRGGPFSPLTFRVSSELNHGHRSLLDQDPILAHGQFNLWHDRHTRSHNHSYAERKRVTSFAGRIWTWRRVHERVKRSGQHDQVGKADCPSIFAPSCVGSNCTQPWRVLAGRPRRIPAGRPRRPFAGAVTAQRRYVHCHQYRWNEGWRLAVGVSGGRCGENSATGLPRCCSRLLLPQAPAVSHHAGVVPTANAISAEFVAADRRRSYIKIGQAIGCNSAVAFG